MHNLGVQFGQRHGDCNSPSQSFRRLDLGPDWGEVRPLGETVNPRGERTLFFRRTEDLNPSNHTPGGKRSPLGVNLRPRGEMKKGFNIDCQ
jgi:hypothetical protein